MKRALSGSVWGSILLIIIESRCLNNLMTYVYSDSIPNTITNVAGASMQTLTTLSKEGLTDAALSGSLTAAGAAAKTAIDILARSPHNIGIEGFDGVNLQEPIISLPTITFPQEITSITGPGIGDLTNWIEGAVYLSVAVSAFLIIGPVGTASAVAGLATNYGTELAITYATSNAAITFCIPKFLGIITSIGVYKILKPGHAPDDSSEVLDNSSNNNT